MYATKHQLQTAVLRPTFGSLQWIPREQNGQADYLAGQAIKNAPRGTERNRQLVKLIKAQRADARADRHGND